MSRPRNHSKHVAEAVDGLVKAVTELVESIGATLDGAGRVASKRGRPAKSGKPSPGRLRQIAAMKAYWKKRNAEKAGKGN